MLEPRTKGVLANLGITEENITWNSHYHFLFGLAWLDLRSACMGIAPLRDDNPYDHADCVMCGEVALDTIESIDSGTLQFCKACKS